MNTPVWLEPNAIQFLHVTSLARFGGHEGPADEDMLSSALTTAQTLFNCGQARDLADIAAAYVFGIVKNHPFTDGNKRAGILACGVFLQLNGKIFLAAPTDTIAAVMALAEGTLDQRGFAAWLRNNLV